jgi:para-aminobenzoate synthetase component I
MRLFRVAGPDVAPVAAVAALRGRPNRFLLHSGSDLDGVGRWSFAGWAEETLTGAGEDPFAALEAVIPVVERDPGGPVPLAVGWLGYDLGRFVERRLAARPAGEDDVEDLFFALPRAVWRHDGRTGRGETVGWDEGAVKALAAVIAAGGTVGPRPCFGALTAPPAAMHLAAVERILAYLRAGDVFQVNLARRWFAPLVEAGDPLALYAALDARVPFGAMIETARGAVLSGSPELFLRRGAGSERVETRPIKGTRARGADPASDRALAEALAADPKERAEHLMIVDLLRNDLGRVAAIGSVVVEDFARVVALPTVHHLISTIAGRVESSVSTAAILRATFPGGSITGAPKVRAMEIIDELEPQRRGVYTGALGYFGAGGEIDLAIVIRSGVLTRRGLAVHVGGGVVIDSTPERELEETEEKGKNWRQALAGG